MGIDRRFIELCVFEIIASDHRTVEEALAAYNESIYSFSGNVSLSLAEFMSSDSVRQILGEILSQTCPGQPSCSGRGTCEDSKCTCSEGNALLLIFISQKETLIPVLLIFFCFFCYCHYFLIYGTVQFIKLTMSASAHTISMHSISYRINCP